MSIKRRHSSGTGPLTRRGKKTATGNFCRVILPYLAKCELAGRGFVDIEDMPSRKTPAEIVGSGVLQSPTRGNIADAIPTKTILGCNWVMIKADDYIYTPLQ